MLACSMHYLPAIMFRCACVSAVTQRKKLHFSLSLSLALCLSLSLLYPFLLEPGGGGGNGPVMFLEQLKSFSFWDRKCQRQLI